MSFLLSRFCCRRRVKKYEKEVESKEKFPYSEFSEFCKDFFISEDLGLSIPEDFHLSDPHFRWEELCNMMPEILRKGNIREFIKKELEVISTEKLLDFNSLVASYATLNKLVSAYVWCSEPIAQSLPEQLARPFYEVCTKLGIKPCNTYLEFSFNWKRRDPSKSIMDLENLTNRFTWTESEDEIWTSLPGIANKLHFGPIWKGGIEANIFINTNDRKGFNRAMSSVLERLKIVEYYPKRVFGKCCPSAFRTYERFFNGTGDLEFFPDGGLYYEGIGEKFGGPMNSGIQDPTYQCFEKMMGISYDGFLNDCQLEARVWMARRHRELIVFLEKNSKIRAFAALDPESKNIYNQCLESFSRYFLRHNSLIKQYLENFMKKEGANQERVVNLCPVQKAAGSSGTDYTEDLIRFSNLKKRCEVILENRI